MRLAVGGTELALQLSFSVTQAQRFGPPSTRHELLGSVKHLGHCASSENLIADSIISAGNNYSITNESRTRTSRIFFAQGCEIEAEGAPLAQ